MSGESDCRMSKHLIWSLLSRAIFKGLPDETVEQCATFRFLPGGLSAEGGVAKALTVVTIYNGALNLICPGCNLVSFI